MRASPGPCVLYEGRTGFIRASPPALGLVDVSDLCRRNASHVLDCQDRTCFIWPADREATPGSRLGDVGTLVVAQGDAQSSSDAFRR